MLPDTERKGTLASPAVALAMRVFPVPGGPVRMAPWGGSNITTTVRWMLAVAAYY